MTTYATAASLRDVVAGALDEPPARRIITVGDPTDPLKGEQLAVGFNRFFTGVPGRPDGGPESTCWGPLVAEFVVRLLRCFDSSTGVDDTAASVVNAASESLLGDAEAIRLALRGWLPETWMSGSDVWVGDVVGYRPQGFGQALQVTVHVAT